MQWAIAEWDYFATHEDELSFRKDDYILIQDSSHEEWWEGECNVILTDTENERGIDPNQTADQQPHVSSPQHEARVDTLDQGREHDITEHETDTTHEIHKQQHEHLSNTPSSYNDHVDLTRNESPPPEPADELSDSDRVLLPPNWSATTNEKGQLYYYNVLTKETSWKFPSISMTVSSTETVQEHNHESNFGDGNLYQTTTNDGNNTEILSEDLPEGWNSAQDKEGSQYFFNSSTGETTWNRPTQLDTGNYVKTAASESSVKANKVLSPPIPRAAPKRQPSVDETILQSQLLSLSLSDEELRALELNRLPLENIQRRGSLRVKSQKVSTNATISSWKDYWVVVYKGFLLFYRDENGVIKNTHSLKPSVESMSKLKQATQVMPSGCFDAEKVAVELPANGQALTKKKNFFYITPGTNVRLLLQDASGGDEKIWVKDIKLSLDSRKSDELSGSEEQHLIQVLKRQTSGGGEASGLKMNKKIEEKDYKSAQKNPLKTDKARGIRNMVTQGIHGPRRKSAQDEKLRLPNEEDYDALHNDSHTKQSPSGVSATPTNPPFAVPRRKSSRDQSKDLSSPIPSRKDHDNNHHPTEDVVSPGNGSSNQGAKAKLSNMSRNFFSKDKESKDKEKEKEKEKLKEKSKDKIKEKNKDLKKEQGQGGSLVFGGMLTVEPGRTIPKVVELCIKTIEARGLSTAGIYRVSGHMASIQNLKKSFNEGLDVDKLIEKEPDVNTIAALLKLYFRELREPLMLFDFYPSFIAAADINEYNEKLYTIKSLVHSLPEANFNTLKYLMMHLGHVQDHYQTTKMDSANLAICFAPNLLRQEVDDLASIINTGKQSSIVDTLIEQREWIFDPYPDDDDEETQEGERDTQEEEGEIQGETQGEPEEREEEDEANERMQYEHELSEHNNNNNELVTAKHS
ncbi:hypothetical protein BGZ46_000043 [Entomortierella lignicola]|nr:hypothetical protein BGZ46_000043 [Entomortierella lignicola]